MARFSYYEDAVFSGDEITDGEIRDCRDAGQLTEWWESAEAAVEDIKGQLEACSLGGCAEPEWVYRCGKSMGFYRRAQSRIKARLIALGAVAPDQNARISELHRKVDETKARAAVALEFLRLAVEGAMPRHEFERLESAAVDSVANKKATKKALAA